MKRYKRYEKDSKRIYDIKPRGRSKPLTSSRRFTSKVSNPSKRSRPLRDEVKLWLYDSDDSAKVARARYVDVAPGLPSEIYTKEIVDQYMKKALPIIDAIKARIAEEAQ